MSEPAKILIVDDEDLIRLNLRALLEDLGYRVVEAAQGREGLGAFDRERPDLVLADLTMPVMDGLSMIAGLRGKSPETPVIVISGTGAVRDAVDALRFGAWDYVIKPVADAEGLDITIKRTLEKARLVKENRLYREHLEELVRERTGELRNSEARYRRLLESVTSYVYTVTLKDGLPGETVHGPGCESLTGFTPEEHAADPYLWRRIVHDDDRPLVVDLDRRILDERRSISLEYRIRHKDGPVRWVRNTLVPYRTAWGELLSYDGVVVDITERKRAETMLNDQLHFLQQLLDSIPIPVFYKDKDGIYLGCNSAFETFIGSSRSQVVGKTVYEVAPRDLADAYHEADSALLCRPGVQVYESNVMHKDGTRHDVIFNKATYVDADGCVIGIVGAIMDITERRKAEEERKLLEAQLHQAQKMEAIGQLAGGIAHDFNNILTAVIGYGEIILMRMEKDSPLRHFVEQVLSSADRAAELTNGLLAFSRRQVLHTKPMDLCGVVRGLKKMLGRLLPEDIEFRTTVAEGNLIVMADKGRIEQVLMNLVTNSRDAMPRGGTLTIEVSPAVMDERFVHAHGLGEPGNYACVSVTDTGHGMDEETSKRIFEPFFTTKEAGKGTGLGMAIIYGIIQQHNGCITVHSETGRGTTFKIYLPLIAEEIKEMHGTLAAEAPAGGTETILLAEDDATVRELHKMILEGAGYKIVEAVHGEEALDKFMEHMAEVDIVATDVVMPKIDGKGLYEEIRKIRPDMKVLFMSGYTRDIIVERGIPDDEFSFITKPVKSSELLKMVRDTLDRN